MSTIPTYESRTGDRRNERGAALVSVLLLAMLLLTAGGALVLTTTMSATGAIDSTAEMQAYYGAEAGLQATINTLRGNVWKDNSTPQVSFRAAVEPNESNSAGDAMTAQSVARLSNWLTYNDNNRVVVPGSDGRIAFDVTARDLDNSKLVRYSTSASFEVLESGCTTNAATNSLTCTDSGVNAFTLTYTPQATTTLTAYPATNANFGTFTLVKTASGATIADDKPVRLRLTVSQTLPWVARDTFIATITGDVSAVASTLKITFSGKSVKVDGTQYSLCAACSPLTLNHPLILAGSTTLSGSVTAPQPKRILVRTTGYGPKGAIKRLEMMVNNTLFDFDAPATLTMRGADNCNGLKFDTGSSGSKEYSGKDNANAEGQLPTFAVTGCELATANGGISKPGTVTSPMLGYLDIGSAPAGSTAPSTQTPSFLRTADDARTLLNDMQAAAESSGRYFSPAPGSNYQVTTANTGPAKLTFVDGDCDLEGGSGLLVVTGTLNMKGNPNFNGIILVLGEGKVERDGGGEGKVFGAMVVASFNRNGNGGFRAPTFETNGGGNSTMQYDSLAVSRALGSLGASVGGVREY